MRCLAVIILATTRSCAMALSQHAGMHRVFVYGTLKRGFWNYDAVLARQSGATFVETGTTVAAYPLFVDAYRVPYLVHAPGAGSRIAGEVFDVDDAALAALDALEGVPGRYDRFEIDVATGGGSRQVRAWLYALKACDIQGRDLLSSYSAADHAAYVPPGPGRDAALLRAWGGYEA